MKQKKQERLSKRKKVLDFIHEMPRQTKELENLVNFSRSTLKRILKELEVLGVIEKRKKYWRWYGYKYPKKLTPHQHTILYKHSKSLMPGLEPLLDTNPTDLLEYRKQPLSKDQNEQLEKYRLSEYVEEHLRTEYPDVYKALVDFRYLFYKTNRLKKRVQVCTENLKGERKPVLSREKTEIIIRVVGHPLFLNDEDEEKFNKFIEARKQLSEARCKLVSGICRIQDSIKYSENFLKGRCKTCPNIIIKEED